METGKVIPFDRARRRPAAAPAAVSTTRRLVAAVPEGISLEDAMESWELALNARNRKAGTIVSYRFTVRLFTEWLEQHGLPTDVESITSEHVQRFLTYERERTSPGNAALHFRNLRALFNWLIKKKERTVLPSPVDADDEPHVPEQTLPQVTPEEMQALMKACSGKSFEDRRDLAIIATFYDTGMRLSGLAGLRYSKDKEESDVRLATYELRITLKGGDPHRTPIGRRAAELLDGYRRARARHPYADEQWLWLSRNGRFTSSGIAQMLERRGLEAEVDGKLHPHRFRRAAAGRYLDNGGDPINLMHNLGWKSLKMVQHYTKEQAKERGRAEHRNMSPLDSL